MSIYFTFEKHYNTLSNYYKNKYHQKLAKIPLNIGLSCPNRDGKLSHVGCTYCENFKLENIPSLSYQFLEKVEVIEKKWSNIGYIAYFQNGTNTYANLDFLKKIYLEVINLSPKIKILSIATRPDCIDTDILDFISTLTDKVDIQIELGFQTSNEKTALLINRCYKNSVFEEAVSKIKKYNIHLIVHIINGLPFESETDMLNTIKYLNRFDIDGIKIHMLNIVKDSIMGKLYQKEPFKLLTLQEYIIIVSSQIRLLKSSIIIHRISGDSKKDTLIEPKWVLNKFVVLNELDKYLRSRNYFQGDLNNEIND
ncbi:MAG: TIGR01212 family radical SAM protein [Acholeplasmatales bacterium]|jgi:radical SAM protein (TIGR01212 family)|nr:TIGR01212 family radical SAM protein [Acholeplasmatales bacterium]